MAKKPMTFFRKVKIIWRWLTDNKYGLTTYCSYCDSTAIRLYERGNTDDKTVDGTEVKFYKAKYICHSCGAIAVASETWSKIEGIKGAGKNDDESTTTNLSNM